MEHVLPSIYYTIVDAEAGQLSSGRGSIQYLHSLTAGVVAVTEHVPEGSHVCFKTVDLLGTRFAGSPRVQV